MSKIKEYSLGEVKKFVGDELFMQIVLKASQVNSSEKLLEKAKEKGQTADIQTWTNAFDDVTAEYGLALIPFRQKLSDNGMNHEEIDNVLARINGKPQQKDEGKNDFSKFLRI